MIINNKEELVEAVDIQECYKVLKGLHEAKNVVVYMIDNGHYNNTTDNLNVNWVGLKHGVQKQTGNGVELNVYCLAIKDMFGVTVRRGCIEHLEILDIDKSDLLMYKHSINDMMDCILQEDRYVIGDNMYSEWGRL